MLNSEAFFEFRNGFAGLSSFSSDTILWYVFIAVIGIFACAVWLANNK